MEDSELEAQLVQYDAEVQDLVRSLLESYFQGSEDIPAAAIAVRRRRLKRELDALEARKAKIKESIRDVKAELELLDGVVGEYEEEVFKEALDKCQSIRGEYRKTSNPSIREHAKELGLEPEEFVEILNERRPTNLKGDPLTQSEE